MLGFVAWIRPRSEATASRVVSKTTEDQVRLLTLLLTEPSRLVLSHLTIEERRS